jgi:hypothetical protein
MSVLADRSPTQRATCQRLSTTPGPAAVDRRTKLPERPGKPDIKCESDGEKPAGAERTCQGTRHQLRERHSKPDINCESV